MKRKVLSILTALATAVCMLMSSVTALADDDSTVILPTNVDTPSDGCVLLGIEGKYITEIQESLDLINSYRHEACEEGVTNPATGEPLTLDDYVPIKWSSDLEAVARIRAAEANVTRAHKRLNGASIWFDTLSYGEVLAWNYTSTMTCGVEQWYEEKSDWVNETGKETGHYEQMINPNNTYVGLGTFCTSNTSYYYNCTAGRFGRSKRTLDETQGTAVDSCIQTLEVSEDYISYYIDSDDIDDTGSYDLTLNAKVTYNNGTITNKATMQVFDDVSWASSDDEIMSVDSETGELTVNTCGTVTITASVLGESIEKELALNHTGEWKITKQATCTTDGEEQMTCERCGEIMTQTIPATGHAYAPVLSISANKTSVSEGDTITYTVSLSRVKNLTKISSLRINLPSSTTYASDSVDNSSLVYGWERENSSLYVSYTKSSSYVSYTMLIDDYSSESPTVICTVTATADSDLSGDELEASISSSAVLYDTDDSTIKYVLEADEWTVVKEATCTETGLKEIECVNCGEALESEVIPALGHDLVSHEAQAASCTEIGWNAYETCSRCDYTTYKEIPATGHSYGEWTVTKEATCVEKGTEQRVCETCGNIETRDIALIDHTYKATVTAPTCTEDGYTTYTCSVCKKSYTDNITPATGHSYEAVVTDPTCTKGGYTTHTCSVCGDSYTDSETSALGHDYVADKVVQPTYTDQGYTLYVCTRCGESVKRDFVDPLAADIEMSVGIKTPKSMTIANVTAVIKSADGEDTQTAWINNGKITLETIADGSYSITFSAANCASRTYDLTVKNGELTTDDEINLSLIGDVNADGELNIKDMSLVYKHINKTKIITDDYTLKVANVVQDENAENAINIKDYSKIYKHINKTSLIW